MFKEERSRTFRLGGPHATRFRMIPAGAGMPVEENRNSEIFRARRPVTGKIPISRESRAPPGATSRETQPSLEDTSTCPHGNATAAR